MPLRQFWADFDVHSVTAKQTSLSSEYSFISALTQQKSLNPPKRLNAVAQKKLPLYVTTGCTVQLVSMHDDLRCWLKLVASANPDISKGEVAELSPLGLAMLGKGVGEQVKLHIPGIDIHFLITDILGD
ncbi:MAG TPA: GreA/GreB family elongation factor [Rheinheimera sp.]|jgi:transcription elongation GreA/GreB family factor|uniref:GreA/GreB family elongation factor n=1 Tax=Rheinheimera TaxID=67575 RepID=UPI000E8183EC|nr:hypothetical protein [Rheinheimera sp.]|tara:strand:- start:1077 stop:1463 length:387 start_codon:yes stop_codon:yes gene_type:complete